MRELLRGARRLTSQWLAVSVSREANGDADRLSHPHLLGTVTADAEGAGWRTARARIPQQCWEALRIANHIGGRETAERDEAWHRCSQRWPHTRGGGREARA
eukprot:6175008-Pleurochrysis_carterae.AAC.1